MRKRHFSAAEKAENPCIYFGHTLNCLISLQLRVGRVKIMAETEKYRISH